MTSRAAGVTHGVLCALCFPHQAHYLYSAHMMIKAEPHLGGRRWKLPWKQQEHLHCSQTASPWLQALYTPAASWSPFPKLLFFHCVFSPSMGTHHFDLPSPGAVGHQMRSGAALGSSSRSLACLLSHSSDVPLGQANPSLP